MSVGVPCFAKTVKKDVKRSSASISRKVGMNSASWSAGIQPPDCIMPCDKGSPSIKSIEIESMVHSPIGGNDAGKWLVMEGLAVATDAQEWM